VSHKYIPITKKLFAEHLSGYERHAFIPEQDIPQKFKQVVEKIAKANEELFLTEAFIVTNELSPLAENTVRHIAQRHGYAVTIRKKHDRLKYLCSDGYGHYSTDFYELLVYSEIHVTPC
jgi:hypothetical protein